MVQFTKYTTWHRAKDYWKLYNGYDRQTTDEMREELVEWNYVPKRNDKRQRLRDLLVRQDLGRLSYNAFSAAELKLFCKQRAVAIPEKISKEELVDILEKADDIQTFPPFMRLPPELRELVYKAHFASFAKPESYAAPPPITRVSKIIRKETWPLWLANQPPTVVHFHTTDVQATEIRFKEGREMDSGIVYGNLLRQDKLRRIKSLMIVGRMHSQEHSSSQVYKWMIEFDCDGKTARVRQGRTAHRSTETDEYIRRRMRVRLQAVVRGMMARDGYIQFEFDDIGAIGKAWAFVVWNDHPAASRNEERLIWENEYGDYSKEVIE